MSDSFHIMMTDIFTGFIIVSVVSTSLLLIMGMIGWHDKSHGVLGDSFDDMWDFQEKLLSSLNCRFRGDV